MSLEGPLNVVVQQKERSFRSKFSAMIVKMLLVWPYFSFKVLYEASYQLLLSFSQISHLVQVCNQEFVRSRKFSWNWGILINISTTTQEKEALQGTTSDICCQKNFKKCVLNRKFKPQIGIFSLNRGTFFQFSRKGRGNFSHIFSYVPVGIRKSRIPLLTKFTIMKLKTNVFSVSKIFLSGCLRWKLSVARFVEPFYIVQYSVKQISRRSLRL